MLTEKRQEKILELVETKGSVTVQELTEYFQASESTIRRDNVSLEMGINPATGKKMKGERANE